MDDKSVVRALAALAHDVRLQVFRALVVVGPRGMTPSVMAQSVGLSSAALSFHLKELMNAGLVTQQRQGRYLVYRAAFEQMNGLLGYLTSNCCQGKACLDPSTAPCKR
jgi:DNA-binding transcriptional ArsR family regulator